MGSSNAKHSTSGGNNSQISLRRRSKSTITKPPLMTNSSSSSKGEDTTSQTDAFGFAGGNGALDGDLLCPPSLQQAGSKFRKVSDQTCQQKNKTQEALELGLHPESKKATSKGSGNNLVKRLSVNSGASTQLSSMTVPSGNGAQLIGGGSSSITPETQTSPD